GAAVGHLLPLGLGLVVGPGGKVDRALTVVVQVGGLGAAIALDRAVGQEAQVGLVAVAGDDDVVTLVDRQLEEGVAADDPGLDRTGVRFDLVDRRPVVGRAGRIGCG